MTRGRGYDIGMTRNHVPCGFLLPPNIREPPLYRPACTWCIPDRLHNLSPHDNGDVNAEPDRLNSPLERRVADQALFDQRQDRASAWFLQTSPRLLPLFLADSVVPAVWRKAVYASKSGGERFEFSTKAYELLLYDRLSRQPIQLYPH